MIHFYKEKYRSNFHAAIDSKDVKSNAGGIQFDHHLHIRIVPNEITNDLFWSTDDYFGFKNDATAELRQAYLDNNVNNYSKFEDASNEHFDEIYFRQQVDAIRRTDSLQLLYKHS